ncbi:MAG: MipA/OmpV family protein [Proteobacteria bacterium]|nr:MipA/OmpV family protein [Pseudomonadota bacterium]
MNKIIITPLQALCHALFPALFPALFLALCMALSSSNAIAESDADGVAEKDWGIAVGFRIARIPFATEEEQVADFIPLMFYDGDIFFIKGLTGGIKLYDENQWQLNLISRYRYFDIPAEYQNLIRGSALDLGVQLQRRHNNGMIGSIELMSDSENRYYGTLNSSFHWDSGSWDLIPYATLRYKSASFNAYYYGLDGFTPPVSTAETIDNRIGAGVDLTIGSEIRYHVASNFYLLGRAQLTTLDKNARDSQFIDNGTYGEVYLGIAFFNDKTRAKAPSLKAKPYIRVAHGWGTPSNFGDILAFDWEADEQDNQITSIFYGHPIADDLFGFDLIDVYITTGYIYHHNADIFKQTLTPGQGINSPEFVGLGDNPCNGTSDCEITYFGESSNEYALGIKAYFNINWPIHWRIGLAEGLSYIDHVSDLEQREMDRKGYRSSKLMNYIDATADFSIGDLFRSPSMKDLFLGIGIHHRSSIFETSSAFGRIKGGSNFNSVYLQYHF